MYKIEEITNKILCGNSLEELKKIPPESINTIMCSPPYWALRDYGTDVETIWDGDFCEQCWKLDKECKCEGGPYYCEHEWNSKTKVWHGDRGKGNHKEVFTDLKEQKSEHYFCSKCGAWKGQLGLEPTFDLYIKHLCDIFDEVKRVLRKDGTCWINLGDTYAGGGSGNYGSGISSKQGNSHETNMKNKPAFLKANKMQSKCLTLIPQRFAIEMVNRGWILRNNIIWFKPNCMPSSVKDRFTVDFEYVFFFVKNKKYWFETQYEPVKTASIERNKYGHCGDGVTAIGRKRKPGEFLTKVPYSVQPRDKEFVEYRNLPDIKYFAIALTKERIQLKLTIEEIEKRLDSQAPHHWFSAESFPSVEDWEILKEIGFMLPEFDKMLTKTYKKPSEKKNAIEYGRNKRTVWTICPKPFKEAHFAVYPEELCETPIKSGCPEFVCKKCGMPKVLDIESKTKKVHRNKRDGDGDRAIGGELQKFKNENPDVIKDYKPTCNCNEKFTGGIVLDPFFGAGTTGLVALKQNKKFIGIELSKEYIKIAKKRLKPCLEQTRL